MFMVKDLERMCVNFLKSKNSIILIPMLLIIGTLFVFKPFINGLGCHYSSNFESEGYIQSDYCKSGILTVHTIDKTTGESSVIKSLWGVWGNTTYEILLSHKGKFRAKNIESLLYTYESYWLTSGVKVFPECDFACYFVYTEPFEAIYIGALRGKVGFMY
ncbi:hypothetical protein VCSRO12_1176 [Vibrio cholerae]|nr:hypothetical protein VCSRO119_3693 [Vibrio cholerae]GHY61614.1 hypothetical protein VCSRO12_1176 [Vibrio cholerae]GIA64549.1 hypothetical protein VCSRO87_3712 [Vibrio cholerae]